MSTGPSIPSSMAGQVVFIGGQPYLAQQHFAPQIFAVQSTPRLQVFHSPSSSSSSSGRRFCSGCGRSHSSGDSFCSGCGRRV